MIESLRKTDLSSTIVLLIIAMNCFAWAARLGVRLLPQFDIVGFGLDLIVNVILLWVLLITNASCLATAFVADWKNEQNRRLRYGFIGGSFVLLCVYYLSI